MNQVSAFAVCLLLATSLNAHAYIDPGSGTFLIQAVLGFIASVVIFFRSSVVFFLSKIVFWRKRKDRASIKPSSAKEPSTKVLK